jgi:hypothetical protein
MNKYFVLMFFVMFVFGCDSENINNTSADLEPPLYDLTGIWAGSIDDMDLDDTISFRMNITQEQNSLYGTLDDSDNYSFNMSGTIESDKVNLHFVCETDPDYIIDCIGGTNGSIIYAKWKDSYGESGALNAFFNIK